MLARAALAFGAFAGVLTGCSGDGSEGGNRDVAGAPASSGAGAAGTAGAEAHGGFAGSTGLSGGGGASSGGATGGTTGVAGSSSAGAAGTESVGGSGAGQAGSSSLGGSAGSAGAAGGGGGPNGFDPCPPPGTPCAIMPLGDSITFGYGSTTGGGYRDELFRKALAAGVSITFVGRNQSGPNAINGVAFPSGNEGYSGYTIDQVSAKVDGALSSARPHVILMMLGTNDMRNGTALGSAPERLGKIIDKIVADAPNALLVVAALTPANGAEDDVTKTFNAAVPGVVKSRSDAGKHVVWVDMYAPLAPWKLGERFKDSVHPNDTGYRLMAETWFSKISDLLR